MIRRLSLLLIGLSLAVPAGAAVFSVTKTADTLDGACDLHDCSLREAISAANAAGGTDVVSVPAGIYTLSRAGAGEEFGATGDLDVSDDLILVGAGAGSTVLDGFGSDRVLDIYSQAEIFGVTIRNGRVNGDGGGILVRPSTGNYTVIVHRVVLEGNEAQGGNGGGIATQHQMTVRESAILSNRATGYGGGIAQEAGFVQLVNSTVSGNFTEGHGGGFAFIFESTPLIEGSTIAFNQAQGSGGGLHARHISPSAGSAALRGSIVARNVAPEDPDCDGAESFGYNVVGVQGLCHLAANDKSGTAAAPLDAKLAPLSGALGPTPVHALLSGSPAFGTVAGTSCRSGDQVGQPRSVPCEAGAWELPEHPRCVPGGSALCLQGGRFRVTASWKTDPSQASQDAQAIQLTDESGNYWFFSPDNLELMVKLLDGCAVNQRWWVFSSGLTDRSVTLRVEDLVRGKLWTYTTGSGQPYPPKLDTGAFDDCTTPGPGVGDDTLPHQGTEPTAVLVVTKRGDSFDGSCDHDCSLREAVAAANAKPGTGVILLGPGVYALSLPGIEENDARTGDLDVTGDLVILGAGPERTILDGGGIDRVLDIRPKSGIEIYDSTIRNGHARPGLLELGEGGGIRALGPLRLVRTIIVDNVADYGGGVFGFSDFVVRDSTVSGNFAKLFGGGLWGNVHLFNVTISGNEAVNEGGGLFLALDDTVLQNVTITGNKATLGGGLSVSIPDCPYLCYGPFKMEQTIVAGNEGNSYPDCWDAPAHYGEHNFFGVGEGCFPGTEDRQGTLDEPLDLRLSPLGNNGGPTPTHALGAGSPALNVAPFEECLKSDQRGRARNYGGRCDAGAVELTFGCEPGAETLCLGARDRFEVTVRWTTKNQSGTGKALPLALDTGAFWFFDPANIELNLKVLDGCSVNKTFWVFLSGVTDVGVEVIVQDTHTGAIWAHEHPPGAPLQPRLDTNALNVCTPLGDPS